MTYLAPLFHSPGFVQLGLRATIEQLGKTGAVLILYHHLFISDVPALVSWARVRCILLTPRMCLYLARAILDTSNHPPLHLNLFPRFLFLMWESARI
jgi:hypothetical protein